MILVHCFSFFKGTCVYNLGLVFNYKTNGINRIKITCMAFKINLFVFWWLCTLYFELYLVPYIVYSQCANIEINYYICNLFETSCLKLEKEY